MSAALKCSPIYIWDSASALHGYRVNVRAVPPLVLLLARFLLSALMGAAYWLFGWSGVASIALLVLLVFMYARARREQQD